ncbi:hypothetical protein SEUCBS139899_000188 [Sporothrix eucalyptigena]
MSAQLAQLLEDRAQYQEQLDIVLASLNDDPRNEELLGLKAELDSALEIIDESMAELKKEESTASSNKKADTQRYQSTPDASAADATATKSSANEASHQDDAARVVYKVNESILARWVTGDKSFYPARIMSVTGSATVPMYTVKFKSYDTIETLRARDIRPLHTTTNNSNSSTATKRKADGSSSSHGGHAETADSSAAHSGSSTPLSPATSTPPPPPPAAHSSSSVPPQFQAQPPPPPPPPSADPVAAAPPPPMSTAIPPPSRFRTIDRFSQGVVSSASPQLYTQPAEFHKQQQQQQQTTGGAANSTGSGAGPSSSATPLGAEEPPVKKFKKIKATKQLEAGKSKWQEFSNKGKTGKMGTKKDSMFRTPEGIHGRVGFTGSGQAMRKDVTRSRHVYQTNDDVD